MSYDPNLLDGNDTAIIGGSTGAVIGNVNDRLKVDSTFSIATTSIPSWSKKLRYIDMNVTSGGIARDTAISGGIWTQVFLYNGSGYIAGLLANVESFSDWEFRLTVDGEIIFHITALDITGDKRYDVDDNNDFNQTYLGISKGSHDRFVWHSPLNSPLYYASSVKFEVLKVGSAKKWQAGLIILSKET